ncbi:MAG: hypothetical protein KDA24_05145 [Deltaproteobacteria bacterium]|nr:hypothetical protein [Deltaproteobacteria bacterium]
MNTLRVTLLVSLSLSLLAGCPQGQNGGPFGGNNSGPFDAGHGGNGEVGGAGTEQPGLTIPDLEGPDGCTVVDLDPSAWNPLYAAYEGGADPFFHLHSTEDTLFFGAEMYTDYGAGWTGETGTFAPDCGANGICVYLVPDGLTVTRAVAGSVDVVSLTEVDGTLQRPAELVFRDMTFEATDAGSDTCFHVEEMTLRAQ